MPVAHPNKTAIVTIVSNNYLHFARTMLQSAKRHHPDYAFYSVIVDRDLSHALALSTEFETIPIAKLNLPLGDEFLFQYNILELNTAVKPWAMEYLFERGHDNVIYVDPDIYFYGRMSDVEQLLSTSTDIVLTPHLLAPVTDDKQPRELDIRRAGTYNFGFCALRNTTNTRNFLRWWQSKLTRDCVNDPDRGLFVDQSWIDLVPGLFENVGILRHKGYNVAYWNIAQRPLNKRDKKLFFVDDNPLVFFHFSGLDPSSPAAFSKHQTRFTLSTVGLANDLVNDYVKAVMANGYSKYANLEYSFGTFSNGEKIPDIFRKLYRQSSALRTRMGMQSNGAISSPIPNSAVPRSPEVAQRIPGPSLDVNADSPESAALLPGYSQLAVTPVQPRPFDFASALCDPWPEISFEGVSPSNAMMALWNVRPDVQSEFPLNSVGSIISYYKWFIGFPPGAQHYSASVISHHAASVKRLDEQAKIRAEELSVARTKNWPGNEQRVHCLYAHILGRAPDEDGLLFYGELCKTDAGFVRAWGEIGLSDESKKKKLLWLRMLKALVISICKVDKRTIENVDKSGAEQIEPTEQSCAGFFPVEADVSTQGVWVTDRVVIPVTARSGDRIRLEGIYFPESIAKQTGTGESIIIFLLGGDEIYSTQLNAHGEFIVECLVPALNGAEMNSLVIKSNKTFVPKNIGPSEDERKLAWRMKSLAIGNKSVFDCMRRDTFPQLDGNSSRLATDHGSVESASTGLAYSGFFQAEADSEELGVWVSANVVVPIVSLPGEIIQLRGTYFPASIEKQTGNGESTLRFFVGVKEVHSVILREPGDFAIEFVLPKLNAGEGNRLHIQCSKTFVRRSVGEGDDDRILSWRMKALTAGRITVFDCAGQNVAASDRRFVPRMTHTPDFGEAEVKLLAVYAPQFLPPPRGSVQWGRNIADWADVSNAKAQYADHHQPHLPVELGFYDHRSPAVLKRQAALAKQYGIAGFCFRHYSNAEDGFADQPLNRFLADPSLDIKFCVVWHDDEKPRQVDAAQRSSEDELTFIRSLLPAFRDVRYLKIDQKPILIVSNVSAFPVTAEKAARWQFHASQMGLPGLYLIAGAPGDTYDSCTVGSDAVVQLPPTRCNAAMHDITSKIELKNPKFAGRVFDYRGLADRSENFAELGSASFEAVMPSWDNEVLVPSAGTSFAGASPEEYANWLSRAIIATSKKRQEEKLIFIYAWNMWSEGAHLEPDQRHGYGYLHATATVLLNNSGPQNVELIRSINQSFVKRFDTVVLVHIYYEDLIDSLFDSYLTAAQKYCDLIVSVMHNISTAAIEKIKDKFGNCLIIQTTNRGRDIRPFIIALRKAQGLGYLYACKVHTKKSLQLNHGDEWRTELWDALLRSADHIGIMVQRFKKVPTLGLLASTQSLYDLSAPATHFGNTEWLNKLLARIGKEKMIGGYDFSFPAGSMYWFRIAALPQLLNNNFVSLDEFELEAGQLNGTLAHAIERIIGCLPSYNGFEINASS